MLKQDIHYGHPLSTDRSVESGVTELCDVVDDVVCKHKGVSYDVDLRKIIVRGEMNNT